MIDIKLLEKNENGFLDRYRESLKNRGSNPSEIDHLLELNAQRKELISKSESSRAQQNKVSQEIAKLKKEKQDASQLLQEMQGLSKEIKKLQAEASEQDEKVKAQLLNLPNICHETTPIGKTEEENVVARVVGEQPHFAFTPKDHADIGEGLKILDLERGGKVAGARFAFLVGAGARLERALAQMILNLQTEENGYTEIFPPLIVNSKAQMGSGQFPKFSEDVFHLEGTDYSLIPTAEVPVTNLYAGEILEEEELPKCFAAYSSCFRSEAGSHGRDTKGIIRQHQFQKVELMKFAHPENSYEEHEKLTQNAEMILQKLDLHYRVSTLCTGDISFGAAKCYDLEVWLPSQQAFREISSCSNFEDFQARRANIRFRPKGGGKPQFVHTLNGSALALGRTVVAILENYQREDGSVQIPEALQPYMGGMKEIRS